jgi:hypothetical protein
MHHEDWDDGYDATRSCFDGVRDWVRFLGRMNRMTQFFPPPASPQSFDHDVLFFSFFVSSTVLLFSLEHDTPIIITPSTHARLLSTRLSAYNQN